METSEQRIQTYYQHPYFQANPGLAEAIILHEQKTKLKFPNEFKIPPFIHFLIGGNRVLFGKVHQSYLLGIEIDGVTTYRLFENKQAFKLFFTQMGGLEQKDLVYWVTQIDDIEFTIGKIKENGGLSNESSP